MSDPRQKIGKERLDVLLVQRGLADSREVARRLIMAGQARVDDQPATKAGQRYALSARIEVIGERSPYVGRGGLKLRAALDCFDLDPSGWIAMDVGASTGGFTDCLLQAGAARVYAIDCGTNQLAWKLRQDPRVVVHEKTNARRLGDEHAPEPVDAIVMDVSFISARKLLQPILSRAKPGAAVVILVKPQFELEPELIGKGGIVRDPKARAQAVEAVCSALRSHRVRLLGVIDSPITGADGNQEYLAVGRYHP